MYSDTIAGPGGHMKPGCHQIKVVPAKKGKVAENVYRMEALPRGKCIIINNLKFDNPDLWRHGSDVDVHLMDGLFKGLHFDCEIHHDLTAKEMKAALEDAANPDHHKSSDCLVVVLMSHGEWDCIYGVDSISLHLRTDVYELFSNENCPTLMGKPKVFIIQACRGPFEDSGTLGPGDVADAIPAPLPKSDKPVTQPNSVLHASGCSDMYVIYASSPGYKAYRNERTGSFFIKTIYEVFSEYACSEDLVELMLRVKGIVKKYCPNCGDGLRKQTPGGEDFGWNKKLYFNPGLREPYDEEGCVPCPRTCTFM